MAPEESSPSGPRSPKPTSPRSTPATPSARPPSSRPRHRGLQVAPAHAAPGTYRTVTGTEALAWGLVAGAQAAKLDRVVIASYPITPSSPVLHTLAKLKQFGVVTFQAEDEIAAMCAAIGAAFGGALGDHLQLRAGHRPQDRGDRPRHHDRAAGDRDQQPARLARRPACRRRPSSPTSTRPSTVVTATRRCRSSRTATPSDCFEVAIEAVRIATKYMTPVMRPHRRLSGQRLRAVADSRRHRGRGRSGHLPHRSGGIPSVAPRPEDAGAGLGRSGDAGPRAPDRRDREGLQYRPHLLRSRRTTRR